MWTPVTNLSKGRGYALEWGTYFYRNMKVLALSGEQQGASATIDLIPEKQLGIAILVDTENVDLSALAERIVDVVVVEPTPVSQ